MSDVGDATLRIDLVTTLRERYYVTEKALALVPEDADRDNFLIELFEQHNGSVYCDELFYHDANPSVWCEVEEVDPDA